MTAAQDQPGAGDPGRFIKSAQGLLRDARPGDAVRLLVSAIRTDPDNGALRFHLAGAMQAAGRVVEAAPMFQHAATLLPGRAEPLVSLGRALERVRKPNEAVDALNQAIALDASDQRAGVLLESLAKRLAHLEAARERLRATTGEQMPAKIRGAALLELGITLDSLGEHSDAFRAFSQGHQAFALTPDAMKHPAGVLPAQVRRAAEAITPELIASFRRDMVESRRPAPTLLVRLMPMTRDRAVEALLLSPGIAVNTQAPFMAQTTQALEEIVPEAADTPAAIASLSRSEIASLRTRYWTAAEKAFSAERLDNEPMVDAAPLNIMHVPLYRALFPNGRVILSIRDPRDMAMNCFFHRYPFNPLTVNFLQFGSVAAYLGDIGGYWEKLAGAIELPTHILRAEDIDWAPRQTLSKLVAFLGQPYHAALDKLVRRRAHELVPEPPETPRDFAPLEPLPSRWTFYRKEIAPHMDKLAPTVSRFNYLSK
jgi:tetratricopeptide (TPR) repeat protein